MSTSAPDDTGLRVDPEEYTEEYYLNDCEGFDVYRQTNGRELSPRLATVFDLGRVRPGERVLDIACGRGELVVHSALRGATAVGLDYAEAATKLTKRVLETLPEETQARTGVVWMDGTRLGFPTASFDVIFMVDYVEHLYPHELDRSLDEAYRVLKPSGRLVIHTAPNSILAHKTWPYYIRHIHRGVLRMARAVNFKDKFINEMMLPKGQAFPLEGDYDHVHVNEQTPDGLATTVSKRGFRDVTLDLKSPPYPPLYTERRYKMEIMALDAVRFLWPASNFWPLNRLFAQHIWVTARRP
jgi:ubiquinone/menaquinone biosynthesis C-methylase UbiE